MPNIYAQESKLNNVKGRVQYITDKERQEEIVMQEVNMKYDWEDYISYEKENKKSVNENIQARETIVALPNELITEKTKLKVLCDELAKELYGENRDFQYAVHWNKNRTNLHVHFIYSEREVNQKKELKTYKRDIWYEKNTNKLAKSNSENGELRFKKGDVMRDKNGAPRYNEDNFTVKDKKYNNKEWLNERNEIIKRVFKEFGHNLNIQNKETPYLSQKKLHKGSGNDYLEMAKNYNYEVKEYNTAIKKTIELKPEYKEKLVSFKTDLMLDIKDINSIERKISTSSIEKIKELRESLIEIIKNLILAIKTRTQEIIIEYKEIKTLKENIISYRESTMNSLTTQIEKTGNELEVVKQELLAEHDYLELLEDKDIEEKTHEKTIKRSKVRTPRL